MTHIRNNESKKTKNMYMSLLADLAAELSLWQHDVFLGSTIQARLVQPEKQQLTKVLLSSIFFMADSVVKGNLMI